MLVGQQNEISMEQSLPKSGSVSKASVSLLIYRVGFHVQEYYPLACHSH